MDETRQTPRTKPDATRTDPPRSALVLGTAGHIDHGKTSLIAALTGVDTDRLPEEKARGITIELGFAALDLDGIGRVSVIDVPGHEGLVRTMVSGATGIDIVLLVVAADESVMPQTREHVAICRLLGISEAVVALTKRDLVDAEFAELAAEEVRESIAETEFADAAIVPVSSRTGDGLAELRSALAEAATRAAPRTLRSGPARLPIDRAFAMRGFGAVVTGTLIGSSLAEGDSVEVLPRGLRTKIRGLQAHGVAVRELAPGSRCAANLQGLDVGDLRRGDVVARPDTLAPTDTADVRVDWLASAPAVAGIASVEFLVGTSERRARLAPIGSEGFLPGERGFARLHVEGERLALLPGDRFILRGFSRTGTGGATLGGGVVLDVAPLRRRRSDPELRRELARLETGDLDTAVRERVRRAGFAGRDTRALCREIGLDAGALAACLQRLESAGDVARAGAHTLVDAPTLERLRETLVAALDAFHRSEPMRPGMQRAALRGRLPENVPSEIADCALAGLERTGVVASEGELVRRPEHRPRLDAAASAAAERILAEAVRTGLEPPAPRDWAEQLGVSLERFRDLVAHLERERRLVRAPGDLWFDTAAVEQLRERVVAHLERHGELDTQSYKALIGTPRRTAMPLMELLDELHVTRRQGDSRVLRKG